MKKVVIVFLLLILTGCGNSCPKGYEQDGDICKKEISHIDPYEDNTCPDDYEYKDNLCIKYASIEIK